MFVGVCPPELVTVPPRTLNCRNKLINNVLNAVLWNPFAFYSTCCWHTAEETRTRSCEPEGSATGWGRCAKYWRRRSSGTRRKYCRTELTGDTFICYSYRNWHFDHLQGFPFQLGYCETSELNNSSPEYTLYCVCGTEKERTEWIKVIRKSECRRKTPTHASIMDGILNYS